MTTCTLGQDAAILKVHWYTGPADWSKCHMFMTQIVFRPMESLVVKAGGKARVYKQALVKYGRELARTEQIDRKITLFCKILLKYDDLSV